MENDNDDVEIFIPVLDQEVGMYNIMADVCLEKWMKQLADLEKEFAEFDDSGEFDEEELVVLADEILRFKEKIDYVLGQMYVKREYSA